MTMARLSRAIWTLCLLCLGTYAGAEFATWIAIGPTLASLDASDFVRVHSSLTRSFKPAMPILGVVAAVTMLLSIGIAALEPDRGRLLLLGCGFALLSVSIAITVGHNDTINRTILGWSSEAPPPDWAAVRDAWVASNPAGTLSLVDAFLMLILAARPGQAPGGFGRLERELTCDIEIGASAEEVWRALVDFQRHREWNRYAPEWRGRAEVGTRLEFTVYPAGKPRRFRPLVVEADPPHKLRYQDVVGSGILLTVDHTIEIVDRLEGRSYLSQCEHFTGLLVPFIWPRIKHEIRDGFSQMNADLKKWIEETGERSD
jgi:hypothetical protein